MNTELALTIYAGIGISYFGLTGYLVKIAWKWLDTKRAEYHIDAIADSYEPDDSIEDYQLKSFDIR